MSEEGGDSEDGISQPYARELARQVDELENENAALKMALRKIAAYKCDQGQRDDADVCAEIALGALNEQIPAQEQK